MITAAFRIGGEIQEIVVKGNELLFHDTATGMTTTLEGLKLSKHGTLKEFPDLEGREDWKKEAVKRLKNKMNEYKTEMEKVNYIKNELNKLGYEPLHYQRAGHRPTKFK